MGTMRHKRSAWLRALLALLFLLSGVAAPPHFHAAASGDDAPYVICTEHGPVVTGDATDALDGTESAGDVADEGRRCCSLPGCCGFVLPPRPTPAAAQADWPWSHEYPRHARIALPRWQAHAFRTRGPPVSMTPSSSPRRVPA